MDLVPRIRACHPCPPNGTLPRVGLGFTFFSVPLSILVLAAVYFTGEGTWLVPAPALRPIPLVPAPIPALVSVFASVVAVFYCTCACTRVCICT